MATWNKFNDFVEQLCLQQHELNTDLVKMYLTNAAPVNTNTVFGTPADISAGFGYTAGGDDTTNTMSENPAGTAEVVAVDITWTAAAGSIGPFQYPVAYNDTNASNFLIGWYDHGSAVTLNDGESFKVDFGADWLNIT
jgi:hypothetical protein